MKSMTDCRVIVAGIVALTGLVQGVGAKTIVVNSYGAAVFVSPGRHHADLALPVSHADAGFKPVLTAFGATTAGVRLRDHDSSSGSARALSGLYEEARRFAHSSGYAWNTPPVDTGPSMTAPAAQSDFRAMLLVGAVLVAYQLRRKHRSLKQSLIAG